MIYRKFSKRQLLAMTWWNRPQWKQYDALICDGAVRAGKTVCMTDGFFLWSMANFNGAVFGICGKTISSLRRNIILHLQDWLGSVFTVTEHRSENKLVVRSADGRKNTYYLFGGQDEGAYALVQGITLAGAFLDEVALMPRSFVEQVCARCSVEGSKLWFNCNPADPEHWFYKEWIQKCAEKRALHLHFTMDDNPGLSPKIRQRYERLYGGVFYRRYVLGQWCAADGLDNTSTVAYRLRLYAGARYFYGYGLGASILFGDRTVALRDRDTAKAVSIEKNGVLDILQGETVVRHNADGTLTLPVTFSITMTPGFYSPGPMEGTGELTLTPILRTSTVRATGANIGEVSMLAITRYSPEFTHSLKYRFGSLEGYISAAGEAVEQEERLDALSLGFLLPESFYGQIPEVPSGECILEITTYAGAEVIGRETAAFTATASHALCAPRVEFTLRDLNPDTLALTGMENTFIRGQSRVQCDANIQGQKGATITSVLINGSPETEFVPMTGYIEVTATDSRGYTTQVHRIYNLVEYIQLTCNAAASRVDPTSGRVRLQVWGQCFQGDFGASENALTVVCKLPDGTLAEIPCTVQDSAYRGETELTGLSYQSAHTLEVVAQDKLSSVSRVTGVNRGVPVFDWGEKDFAFRVPVTAAGGINGVHMQSFSAGELWLTPEKRPQSYLIAGQNVLGILTATDDGCTWQGTEGLTPLSSETGVGLTFAGDTAGVILSNAGIQ